MSEMNIDNIMKLADEYRDACMFPKQKREELRAATEQALAAQPKQEPKLPDFFTEVEWVGNQMRVHVFQRRADQTPLNVCSQTHNVAPQHPGYAGVTVWLGDKTVTHVVSEEQIKYELWQGHALMYTAQMCLDLLAIHKGN